MPLNLTLAPAPSPDQGFPVSWKEAMGPLKQLPPMLWANSKIFCTLVTNRVPGKGSPWECPPDMIWGLCDSSNNSPRSLEPIGKGFIALGRTGCWRRGVPWGHSLNCWFGSHVASQTIPAKATEPIGKGWVVLKGTLHGCVTLHSFSQANGKWCSGTCPGIPERLWHI